MIGFNEKESQKLFFTVFCQLFYEKESHYHKKTHFL